MINDNAIAYKTAVPILSPAQANAKTLEMEIAWCEAVIQTRLQLHFGHESPYGDVEEVTPPQVRQGDSQYGDFIHSNHLGFSERLLLILALLPFIRPSVLDVFWMTNEQTNRPYSEFGGVEVDGVYCATGETLAFLLAGFSMEKKLAVQARLAAHESSGTKVNKATRAVMDLLDNTLAKRHHTPMFLPLLLAAKYVPMFTTGEKYVATLDADFPAQRVVTQREWASLLLPASVLAQLEEIKVWLAHRDTLLYDWDLASKIRPGYRALFYGPPGTGKTMTVGVLGNVLQRDVYKVDLSMILSKYIGETEKNLERVFTMAETNGWLLFFDEADAVFGKRTQTSNANDQFANQNVSYLLQRIERFHGLVILASNYKDNFDDAFFRRFESVIQFPKPDTEQRLAMWRSGFSSKTQLEPSIDLHDIAAKYDLTGAAIMNVIRFVSLKALGEGRTMIMKSDINDGIHREIHSNILPRW